MTKTCIKDYRLTPTIPIAFGTECKVELNPVDRQFWIYTVWGMAPISIKKLNEYFI